MGYHLIKAAVFNLNEDIGTMDEELPLLIYIIL